MANSYYETELRAGFLKNLTTADKEAYTRAILSGVGIGGILALRNKIRQKQERQNREREEARRSQQFREPFQEFRARDKIIGMVSRASMAAEKLKKQRLFPKTTVKDGVTYRQNSILDTGLKSAKKAGAKAKAKFKTKKRNLKTAAKSALKPPLRQRRLRRGEAPPVKGGLARSIRRFPGDVTGSNARRAERAASSLAQKASAANLKSRQAATSAKHYDQIAQRAAKIRPIKNAKFDRRPELKAERSPGSPSTRLIPNPSRKKQLKVAYRARQKSETAQSAADEAAKVASDLKRRATTAEAVAKNIRARIPKARETAGTLAGGTVAVGLVGSEAVRRKKRELSSDTRVTELSDTKYTKPELRKRIVQRVKASGKGGSPGQWSARKAQIVAQRYKAAGGGYRGGKKKTQKSLTKWTKQKWRTKSGKPSTQGPKATGERYLPSKAIKSLTSSQYAATSRKKREGMKRGAQFVKNTSAAARASKRARKA